ncbi:DUF3999 family protein [Arenimonas composti]|uniref:DUF3999 domain-containing protein n=1 Tax=Arenimonas composti TR7-09 = DSM 18010 TaxID=1121013 RepID=A0A091BD03_9GAMM|nr:DUF3999 family protein [Arenimonas composti]KFN49387.1 hypothetical protein P873_01060 [Arenimonas composti TR7-09 = DSM 18010]
MRSLVFLPLLAALAGSAGAQTPDDFAWAWPLQTPGDDGVHVVELDDAVYARLARDDLRDLVVFNADGQAVPFAPLAAATRRGSQRAALRWMRVPVAPARGGEEQFSLRLQRDADGTLRDLQLDSRAAVADAPAPDLLVDLGDEPPSVSALQLSLGDDVDGPVNLRVTVLESDDLAGWRTLASGLALVSLQDGGLAIERLRLDFAPSRQRYLRLALANGGDWPALARIESEREHVEHVRSGRRELLIEGEAVAGEAGTFRYRLPGPLPVEAWDLLPAATNTVAAVHLETRADDGSDTRWRHLADGTVFRIGSGDDEVRQLPGEIAVRRDRHWQVRTTPALAQPPTLRLSWRPDRFVLLAQPPAPYALHAGSVRAVRPDYPVQAALGAATANRPAGWEPPLAAIGEGHEAAGDLALQPDRGPEYRRWALWAVLAAAGLLVLGMALRVLRQPGG